MMKLRVLVILSFLFFYSEISLGQISEGCNLSSYYIQFFQDTSNIEIVPVKDLKLNQHRMLFKSGFDSSEVKIFINGKFYKEIMLFSEKSTSNTSEHFDFICKDKCKVRLLVDNECIDFLFFKDYKLANISKYNDEWYITFSNYYWFSE